MGCKFLGKFVLIGLLIVVKVLKIVVIVVVARVGVVGGRRIWLFVWIVGFV